MTTQITVREIKSLLQQQCPALLRELVPHMVREGNVYCAPNPQRAEKRGKSFKIWAEGQWKEYDNGDCGDIIDLIAYAAGGFAPKDRAGRTFAIEWAKKRLGLDTGNRQVLARARKDAAACNAKARQDDYAREERIRRRVWQILGGARPLKDTHVAAYLAARGIFLDAIPSYTGLLRWHPHLEHWTHDTKKQFPAMIAPVIQPDGVAAGVHCTFLDREKPQKAAGVTSAKLMLGIIAGGIVPISHGSSGLKISQANAELRADPVILAEGVETALSLAMAVPEARVWACLSLSNLANAPVQMPCVCEVIVALENDIKPQAVRLREKVLDALVAKGKPVATMEPPSGNDFNDTHTGE